MLLQLLTKPSEPPAETVTLRHESGHLYLRPHSGAVVFNAWTDPLMAGAGGVY
jgi:hypothetical protein